MPVDQEKLNQFLERAVADLAAGAGGVMVSLGHKLGLYRALAGAGPLNSQELARRAGCAERYVREWLNSQAAGGYVVYQRLAEVFHKAGFGRFRRATETPFNLILEARP